jgi:hypothetical protein
MIPAPPRTAAPTLADKLNRLFDLVRRPDGSEYSFEAVADALREGGRPTVSGTYIWQLRKGVRDNPTKRHLEALADFFCVTPACFYDDAAAARVEAELRLLAALRDTGVRELALRAVGLSPASLCALTSMIERLRQLEDLDPPRTADELVAMSPRERDGAQGS